MNATKEHVKSECNRMFAAIPLIASIDKRGKEAIVDALLRHCQNNEHVTLVLQKFSENVTDWRNPVAELVRIARENGISGLAPAGCDRCALGPDITTGEMRWAAHVSVKRGEYDSSARCPGPDGGTECLRGKWLIERDRENRCYHPDKKRQPAHDGKAAAVVD